jgi:lipopolysaccharide transport system permease protein
VPAPGRHSTLAQADTATLPASATKLTIVDPSSGWAALRLGELWDYRELLFFLIWRDVKVRYKQTALGVAWAVLQPLLTMFVFSLFFGRLARIASDGLPYPVFNLAGLVPWTFFAFGLNEAATSVVGSRHLITKVYFPRLAIPLATVLAGLVDFAVAFVLLLTVMAWYGIVPGFGSLFVIPLVLLAFVTALGAGLWLAALNVQYRDVRYVLPFLTQLWLFATPIVYPSSLVPAAWRPVYGLNPMVGVVDGFRWALLGSAPPGPALAVSACAALAFAVGGIFYFRRMERAFADIV